MIEHNLTAYLWDSETNIPIPKIPILSSTEVVLNPISIKSTSLELRVQNFAFPNVL